MISSDTSLTWFCVFILILTYGGAVYYHELVHVKINEYYGVDSSGVLCDLPFSCYVEAYSEVPDSAKLAHSINEAITYPLQAMFVGIGFLLIFLSLKRKEVIVVRDETDLDW